jgi:two-component system, cell cycle response regulator
MEVVVAVAHRVLVVDDDELTREVLDTVLDLEDYDVETVADGESALAAVRDDPPDVVVLDVMMPDVDGFEVCRRLKADPATDGVPVILLTALTGSEDRAEGERCGADAFLTKPFSPLELIHRVEALAGGAA